MKKSFYNSVTIAGILYQHDLKEKKTGPNSKNPGTVYITGTIGIATDDQMENIVTVHYTYVTPTTAKGNTNKTYSILSSIINGTFHNYMEHGDGVKLSATPSIGLNEFYVEDNNNGQTELRLVSAQRNEGGFLSVINALPDRIEGRNRFKCDMLITKVTEVEANEDTGLDARVTVGGCIFDFRNQLLPVEFVATAKEAMNYFLGLDASQSHPVPITVWGPEIATTIKKRKVTESAFGEDEVQETVRTRKEFIITGASVESPDWDDPAFITAEELKALISEREIYLATLKKNHEDWKANKEANNKTAVTNSAIKASASDEEFKF